jgi:hypothetical protein
VIKGCRIFLSSSNQNVIYDEQAFGTSSIN